MDLAKELKSMIVTAEQIKISGAGFILKTMRTFTKGESGEIIRKLYRRYNRALVQLDMTDGDEYDKDTIQLAFNYLPQQLQQICERTNREAVESRDSPFFVFR